MNVKDPADILTIIKPSEVYKKGQNSFLFSLANRNEDISWEIIINEANLIKLDKGYIEFLVSSL